MLVALGALVGAPLRYLIDHAVQRSHDTEFPWGTFTVNIVAAFVLGIVTASTGNANVAMAVLLGTGFCGALSTYSTFSYETLRLLEKRARLHGILNVAASIVAGLGSTITGLAVGHLLA
jgi:fluoride exporter